MKMRNGSRSQRGRASRLVALTAGAVVALSPMIATTAAEVAQATPAARAELASAEPVPVGDPWWQDVAGSWAPDDSIPLSSTTRHVVLTVPPEFLDFDAPVTARIDGEDQGTVLPTTVDRPARSVSFDIPEGYFASPDHKPYEGTGSPIYFVDLFTEGSRPEGVVLPPDRYSSEYHSQGILAIEFAPGGPGATDLARTVSANDSFTSSRRYWAEPSEDLHVLPGDHLQLGSGLLFDRVSGGALQTEWERDSAEVPVATAIAPSGDAVDVVIPTEQALASIIDRRMWLSTSGMSNGTSVQVGIAVTIDHRATSGPGSTTWIAGTDRYAGAIAFSRALNPSVVHAQPGVTLALASGEKFPDALSAAAGTAHVGGDLLLVTRAYATDPVVNAVAYESSRIGPAEVRPVGGRDSLLSETSYLIADMGGTNSILTLDGADRYAVSQRVAWAYFPEGARTVFIATGENWPDALAAVPAAASQNAPVLLVPGSHSQVDQATITAITNLGTQRIVLVGGPASISTGIEAQLSGLVGGGLERVGGADRFEVATAVNTRFFPSTTEAFVATGSNYPDALTGGVLAASHHAPLLLVRPDCVPAAAHRALERWGVERTTLLGGPASLGQGVMDLRVCA